MFQTNKFTAYIEFSSINNTVFPYTNIVEIQAREIHAGHPITLCRTPHLNAFEKTAGTQVRSTHGDREGAGPSETLSLGIWITGYDSQDGKKEEHIRTTTRLTLAMTTRGGTRKTFKGTVEIQLRTPWIHSWISSPGPKFIGRVLKRVKPTSAPELQLNCMGLRAPRRHELWPGGGPWAVLFVQVGVEFLNVSDAYGKIMPWVYKDHERLHTGTGQWPWRSSILKTTCSLRVNSRLLLRLSEARKGIIYYKVIRLGAPQPRILFYSHIIYIPPPCPPTTWSSHLPTDTT